MIKDMLNPKANMHIDNPVPRVLNTRSIHGLNHAAKRGAHRADPPRQPPATACRDRRWTYWPRLDTSAHDPGHVSAPAPACRPGWSPTTSATRTRLLDLAFRTLAGRVRQPAWWSGWPPCPVPTAAGPGHHRRQPVFRRVRATGGGSLAGDLGPGPARTTADAGADGLSGAHAVQPARHALRPLLPGHEAGQVASMTASLIDGVWLRAALSEWREGDGEAARSLVTTFVDSRLQPPAPPRPRRSRRRSGTALKPSTPPPARSWAASPSPAQRKWTRPSPPPAAPSQPGPP